MTVRTPIRVAVTYRVVQHWRLPIFRRLAAHPDIDLHIFHGADFPGTKVVNAKSFDDVAHTEMRTIRALRGAKVPFCPALLGHLGKFRPDVILAEGNSNILNNLLVFIYSMRAGAPVVFWTLGELQGKQRVGLKSRLFSMVTTWMERRAGALLGYSSVAISYFDRCGYKKEKQFLAVNCVDTDLIQERLRGGICSGQRVREQYQLGKHPVVLFVGALTPEKRLHDLVDAIQIAQKRLPDIRLLIVGDGPSRLDVERHVAETGVDGVVFAGQQIDGISDFFLAADLFVLPHLGGLAISEAMAHGLPVIATVADGCEVDLIEKGRNGYLCDVGDVAGLSERIAEILADDVLLGEMKARSLWIIGNRHNVHTYLQGIVSAVMYAAQAREVR